MRKIKIYIFHPYSKVGGADLSISRLINNLNLKKYNLNFICLQKPGIKKYLKKNIKIIKLKSKRTLSAGYELKKIISNNMLEDLKYKKVIFISNQNFANVISILSLNKFKHIKKVLIERNNPVELDFLKNYKNKIIKRLIPLTYNKADMVIGISKELSHDLSKLAKTKVRTIYNPSFDKSIKNFNSKKKHNNIKTILCVARFEKQKNHMMLLKAFRLSLKKLKSNLVLVGYGSEKKKIIDFIKKNNLSERIKIVLNPPNVYDYYKNADLFVLTSLYEGFGNVLVEAGIFKLPIISTKCKSGPKEILGNGKYGNLVKVNDIKNLSKLINNTLKNPKKEKISLMFKSLNRFTIENHIKNYEKVFNEL